MAKIDIFKKSKLINPGDITTNQKVKTGLKKLNQKRRKMKAIKEEAINKKVIIRKNCISKMEMETKFKKHIGNLKVRLTQKDIISIKTKNIKITMFMTKENMIKKKLLTIKIDMLIIDQDNTIKNIRRNIQKTIKVSQGISNTITKIREDSLIQIKEKVENKEDLKIQKIQKQCEKDKIKRIV
jgi:hypothetical protein